MDKIAQRIFASLFGMATIIAALAALIHTTTPAVADTPNNTYSTGKYMMDMQTMFNNDDNFYYYILVWDTETGKSQLYSGTQSNGVDAAFGKYNLPTSPL